jgi:glycosyltransferase involved in cell wall biosynthesis
MRILHVIPSLGVGGAERTVAILADLLRRMGHSVGVASMYDSLGTWIEADLRSEGIALHFLGKRPGLDLRMVPRIERVIRRFRPDVVHTHMHTLKYALPGVARWRCRAIHTVHTLAGRSGAMQRAIDRLAFKAGVIPVAIGQAVAQSMLEAFRIPQCRIVPNGIPVSDFEPSAEARDAVRVALAIPADAPTFVAIARFSHVKNHAALIRAFSSKRLESIGAHLLLAGDGELRGEVETQVRALNLRSRVHFLGVRSDVARLLAAADVFVLASRAEGNPLSIMEAMASGKPVVATAVGCVPELVPAGAGRLAPSGDEGALEAAMFEFASDPALARAAGAAASRHARERFDAAHMAKAYEQLYVPR